MVYDAYFGEEIFFDHFNESSTSVWPGVASYWTFKCRDIYQCMQKL